MPRINALRILFLGLIVGSTTQIFGQNIPTLDKVTVAATAVVTGDAIRYVYLVQNGSSSNAAASNFQIDISQQSGTATLDGSGLTSDSGFITAPVGVGDSVSLPVGVSIPKDWRATTSTTGGLVWFSHRHAQPINPGTSLGGFEITSRGLPAVRTFTVAPYINVETLGIPTDDLGTYYSSLRAIKQKAAVTGVTIAPTAPPAQFDALVFLNGIIGDAKTAATAGWIKDNGILNSIDAKLNAASDAVKRGQTVVAKNNLNALLNEVNAQANKSLSPEAVALLKFNVQYLVSKL
jgi:hypothetical protein